MLSAAGCGNCDPTQHREKVYVPVIGGVLFGAMAGHNYWFPTAFGFRLDERRGKASFLIDGASSTSGAAPCTSSSANRYFAFWPPGASV